MSTWTATRIAEHIAPLLCDTRLILVSNREPCIHRWHRATLPEPAAADPSSASKTRWDLGWVRRLPSQVSRLLQSGEAIRCSRPAGGVTSALDPVMQACHGIWVAWGSGTADRETVNARDRVQVPPNNPQYTLRRVWLSDAQVRGFYYGFANSTLWPLCHLHLERAAFKPAHWRRYQDVNARFGEAVTEECEGAPAAVWIQDYHLALCPAYLRQRLPHLPIMQFWHIPWPPWELYRVCPWRRELLEGLLANDLIGFHLEQYCKNFLECAERVLGASVDHKGGLVEYIGRETWVRPFPISIDYDWWAGPASHRRAGRRITRLRAQPELAFPILGLGVDRLDYTKGIVSRFEAIERFLEKYPEFRGCFGFVQIAVPSRTQLEDYRRVKEHVESLVERINKRFGSEAVTPIHYRYEHLEPAELVVYYRMADFVMVTSLHDGMNLVAKEFVASQVERKGVLICSEFAGAAEELDNALLINPYDIESVADTLKQAIEMPPEERSQRMARLQTHVAEHNIYKWLADIFTTLDHIRRRSDVTANALVE
ncbi:MAG: trehalose-6-phosphate synthase [Nitrospinae bacterium]|nr:trehalose-6-phosphate synthase [Nitrospinota bacterium]